MQAGFVGLGKMGMNMVARLVQGGHGIVGFDTDPEKGRQLEALGQKGQCRGIGNLGDFRELLKPPRVVWVMVPAGTATGAVTGRLAEVLEKGDVIVDGGNSNFNDTVRRHQEFCKRGVHLVDAGTSGGVWGLENGYCLMVGGDAPAFQRIEPLLQALAAPGGYLHTGPAGSGHYAKMVHNAIEYGMMQSYAEGFALLEAARENHGYGFDMAGLAELWGHGAVIRSWLLDLLARALKQNPELHGIAGYVDDSGTGRWAAKETIDSGVAAPVLTLALQMRFASRDPNAFSNRINAALRNQFGGHAVHAEDASDTDTDKGKKA